MKNRLLHGALAGIVGTAAMTAAMHVLHRQLATPERYPLPPREIVQRIAPERVPEEDLPTATLAAHFAYGAAAGALLAWMRSKPGALMGAVYGILVWAGSYLGWIPFVGILKGAFRHPAQRNALMIGAHLVWGSVTALTLRELARAETDVFSGGVLRDAPTLTDTEERR